MSIVGTARDMHTDEFIIRTKYKFTIRYGRNIERVQYQKHEGVHHRNE